MLILLIMLRSRLLCYVCIKYGNNVTYVFIKVSNSLKRHNYIITCFDIHIVHLTMTTPISRVLIGRHLIFC